LVTSVGIGKQFKSSMWDPTLLSFWGFGLLIACNLVFGAFGGHFAADKKKNKHCNCLPFYMFFLHLGSTPHKLLLAYFSSEWFKTVCIRISL